MRPLELLAPARNGETGIAAISAGADAVYIGGPRFGARASAGNDIGDIEKLAAYAHRYRAKVYVTLNTILFDNELEEAAKIVRSAWNAGADAIIIQDMAFLEMDLPPVPLFASTQADNSSPEKVLFLEKAGFSRVILARELSLSEIAEIRKTTSVALESFVHGALCVSYSGRCWLSYSAGGRSGNRGDCAQPCRMTWDLTDAKGRKLAENRYLLSLKDMKLSGRLRDLAEAGVSSFKIEGRLKDASYVKNAVAQYRKELDDLIAEGLYSPASQGFSSGGFTPAVEKTFNRGFSSYFLDGRKGDIASFYTQKSIGESLGKVTEKNAGYFLLDRPHDLRSGDGICFFSAGMELGGMQIEHVEDGRIYPKDIRFIQPGMEIRRNHDHAFTKTLESSRFTREIPISLELSETGSGFRVSATDEEGNCGISEIEMEKNPARDASQALETIQKQLRKLGGTTFVCESPAVHLNQPWFFPVSLLNQLRRESVENLELKRVSAYRRIEKKIIPTSHLYMQDHLTYESNISNRLSADFYRRHGVKSFEQAAETGLPMEGKKVMTTRHCLKREMGLCSRYPVPETGQPSPFSIPPDGIAEPLNLSDGRRNYRVRFDCAHCNMELFVQK